MSDIHDSTMSEFITFPGFEHVKNLTGKARDYYERFLQIILNRRYSNPIVSVRLEDILTEESGRKFSGSEIRAMRRYAWSVGERIGSGGKGYYLLEEPEHVHETDQQITGRHRSLAVSHRNLMAILWQIEQEKGLGQQNLNF